MRVYLVGYTTAYEGSDIAGIYSTRELAEKSWEYRNDRTGHQMYEILEFDLDFDKDADTEDIDRRPMFGPRTYFSHMMNETFNRQCLENLTAPSPLMGLLKPLPISTGKEIKFFSYELPKTGKESI